MTIDKTVQEAKRYGVMTCTREVTLLLAAQRMVEEDVSALVVVDAGGGLQGIISRTDMLRASMEDINWQRRTVSEYMKSEVVTVSEDASIGDVASILIDRQIHRVVVTKLEQGKTIPVAVVSAADVVYHMAQDPGAN